MTNTNAHLGVIGGSGLYDMPGLTDISEVTLETPFGAPSDAIVIGTLEGVRTAFLPRHGRGHRFTPSEVNYRANLWALRKLGCHFVVSVSAVGSLKETIAPGHMVVVDQFIDRTLGRARTFFGDGVVAHVPFGDPVCPAFRALLLGAVRETGAVTHDGGTYVCIEGPTFSTKAESHLFRSWGASVVGMTNLPEARLAREAGISYATIALATDYDCWHVDEAPVTVDAVVAVLKANVERAQKIIRIAAGNLPDPQKSKASSALANALLTPRDRISDEAKKKLAPLLGRYVS
jgi:5'-methylthioadenosine phosphorylase